MPPMRFRTVATVGDLQPGDIVGVAVEGVEMALYRVGDEYFAVQRRCLHQGGDLVEGLISRGSLICSLHGWRFDAKTGVHELSPETCLATYQVRVEGDAIQIDPTPIRRGAVPS
jgi:nitrite reductase/ring-hydroxylating ferredoxin subunit